MSCPECGCFKGQMICKGGCDCHVSSPGTMIKLMEKLRQLNFQNFLHAKSASKQGNGDDASQHEL